MEDMFFTAEITACDSEEYEEIIRSRLEKEEKIEQQNITGFDKFHCRKE